MSVTIVDNKSSIKNTQHGNISMINEVLQCDNSAIVLSWTSVNMTGQSGRLIFISITATPDYGKNSEDKRKKTSANSSGLILQLQ